jgi:hypothetical protein
MNSAFLAVKPAQATVAASRTGWPGRGLLGCHNGSFCGRTWKLFLTPGINGSTFVFPAAVSKPACSDLFCGRVVRAALEQTLAEARAWLARQPA